MKRTIGLLLFPLLWIACKKDSDAGSYTFTGVVLNQADHKPVPNANVGITLLSDTIRQYSTTVGSIVTTTDINGRYTITVKGLTSVKEYLTGAWAKGMIQLRDTWRQTADQLPDTLLLDKASYVKIEIVLKTAVTAQQQLYLSWDFLKPTDPPAISSSFYRSSQALPFTAIGHAFNLLDSFSYAERPRFFAQWRLSSSTATNVTTGKDVPLVKDTNTVRIEY
jgi:hypothetical protein